MTHLICPAPHARALARLLGESERTLRALIAGSLLLALAAALACAGSTVDTGWVTEGNEGSARVVQALLCTLALLGVATPAGLLVLGRWAAHR